MLLFSAAFGLIPFSVPSSAVVHSINAGGFCLIDQGIFAKDCIKAPQELRFFFLYIGRRNGIYSFVLSKHISAELLGLAIATVKNRNTCSKSFLFRNDTCTSAAAAAHGTTAGSPCIRSQGSSTVNKARMRYSANSARTGAWSDGCSSLRGSLSI